VGEGVVQPVLSVVTPVYNGARFLPDALESVARLTVPHEHIVVDGGSTDGTVEQLAARRDPSLVWLSEPDRGQTQAVNKGLARASGELVGWLNGDDAYIPEAVDRAVGHLLGHPEVGAVFGGMHVVNERGAVRRRYRPGRYSWRRYLFFGDYIPTPSIIFRRRLLERIGRLDERYADAADYDFYLRLFHSARVERRDEALVRFRYHPQSKSYRAVTVQLDEALQIRLGWARGARERALMRGLDILQRGLLLRLTPWPRIYRRG
jgi:glycosyltransferase involved in cell wall biosynthesis